MAKRSSVVKRSSMTAQEVAAEAIKILGGREVNAIQRLLLGKFFRMVQRNQRRFSRDLRLVLYNHHRQYGGAMQPASICKEMLKQLAFNHHYVPHEVLTAPLKAYANAWLTVLSFESSEKQLAEMEKRK